MANKFAIISDIYGERTDIPSVKMSNAFSPDSRNVFLQYGLVRTMPGRADTFLDGNGDKTVTPDGFPVIHFHRHVSAAGVEYEFVYTKAHVYYWKESTKAYVTYFTCSSNCTLWDSVSINGKVISTNGIDFVQVWNETTPGTVFAPLGSASGLALGGGDYLTAAKYCKAHEGYLWLGYTTEAGVTYSTRGRWSSYGLETDFDETGTGDTGAKDFNEGFDCIKGFGSYTFQDSRTLVVFKGESHFAVHLIESDAVWDISTPRNTGLLATHSAVNDKYGNLYYISHDFTVQKYMSGEISQFKDAEVKAINITYQNDIEAAFVSQYNQIWFAIPSSAASTGNDLVLAYNINYGIWHTYNFDIRAFGKYSQQSSVTIDELDTLAASIDALDEALAFIDSVEQMSGLPLDLGSDYDGYVYALHRSETDKGESMEHYFVLSTDLAEKQALSEYKRFQIIRPFLKGQQSDNTISFSVKEDGAANYSTIGSMSLNTEKETIQTNIGCDLRARHFLFKGYSANRFDFIGMFFPDWYYDGDD